jgi:hypothetical protein
MHHFSTMDSYRRACRTRFRHALVPGSGVVYGASNRGCGLLLFVESANFSVLSIYLVQSEAALHNVTEDGLGSF